MSAESSGYVHGQSDAREVARLEKQARFFAGFIFPDLDVPAGARVLDLATGVGAMAGELRRAWPDALVVGIDLSAAQLEWARRHHAEIPVARADAAHLPFPDSTFDRVHCSWLLEHVRAPVPILTEVRRVLRPGGYCLFTEVDNATFTMEPPSDLVAEVMAALAAAQVAAGGDPYVGAKLDGYFAEAGFARVERSPRWMHGHPGEPRFFDGFVTEVAEIFEGLDESLGAIMGDKLNRAAHVMREHPARGGEMRFHPAMVKGWK